LAYGLVNEYGKPTDGSFAMLSAQHWKEMHIASGTGEP
jgi:hypothetical protein